MFNEGSIDGVKIVELKKFTDSRGWLMELFRDDEVDDALFPAMGYISMTQSGIARGPHEHVAQTDYFCFTGPSSFKVFLWDNRPESPTYKNKMTIIAGEDNPIAVIIPPGIVHAYKNIGDKDGMVLNYPNKLYMGPNKAEEVDEVRYEDNENSEFKVD